MKKIPKAVNIEMFDCSAKNLFSMSNFFFTRKHVILDNAYLLPVKDLAGVLQSLRTKKNDLSINGYELEFRMIPVTTFEEYCKFIADHMSKEQMTCKSLAPTKIKTKLDYFSYLMDCIDFLIGTGVKGRPWSQKEFDFMNHNQKLDSLKNIISNPFDL